MNYKRPSFLVNNHLETIYPAIFRKILLDGAHYETIETPDQDFLEIKWYSGHSKNLVILSHGLEGNFDRAYILGMVKAFISIGYDVLTWNYRGCGNQINRQPRFYHSGATDDLDTIIQHGHSRGYESINLIGFSLGGNITLKYLGEQYATQRLINKVVAISVPLNLDTSCSVISQSSNWIYSYRFLKSLKNKVRAKSQLLALPNVDKLNSIKSIREFDEWITGPLHGFQNAKDYYSKCSSLFFLEKIKVKTLIINALNDPFLSPDCYPTKLNTNNIQYLYPEHGGHVGFTLFNKKNLYWSEIMAQEFIAS